jgi:hypothetical protein
LCSNIIAIIAKPRRASTTSSRGDLVKVVAINRIWRANYGNIANPDIGKSIKCYVLLRMQALY